MLFSQWCTNAEVHDLRFNFRDYWKHVKMHTSVNRFRACAQLKYKKVFFWRSHVHVQFIQQTQALIIKFILCWKTRNISEIRMNEFQVRDHVSHWNKSSIDSLCFTYDFIIVRTYNRKIHLQFGIKHNLLNCLTYCLNEQYINHINALLLHIHTSVLLNGTWNVRAFWKS